MKKVKFVECFLFNPQIPKIPKRGKKKAVWILCLLFESIDEMDNIMTKITITV